MVELRKTIRSQIWIQTAVGDDRKLRNVQRSREIFIKFQADARYVILSNEELAH